MFVLKTQTSISNLKIVRFSFSECQREATVLTSALADVSSFVLAVVVIPVATVNEHSQAVFTVVVVGVSCEEGHKCVAL